MRCGSIDKTYDSFPRRGKRPEFEGGWRAEKRKSLWLVPCGTRAPRGAPITAFSGTGPCFRPVRRASHAPTEPSASSWQGLLVVPEGAPLPPECLVATRPAGAAPRPASRRLMIAPLSGRGGCSISEVWRRGLCGDKAAPSLLIPVRKPAIQRRTRGEAQAAGGKGRGIRFCIDAPSALTPDRAPNGARALPQGESGSLLQAQAKAPDRL